MKFNLASRMCYSKRRYPNEIAASCGIGRMRAKYPDAATVNWKWYLCPVCRGYHVTKADQNSPEIQKTRWMLGMDVKVCP